MLPCDTKDRREGAKGPKQTSLDDAVEKKERVIAYSSEAFLEAARAWLIETDQVSARHHHYRKELYSPLFEAFECYGSSPIPRDDSHSFAGNERGHYTGS